MKKIEPLLDLERCYDKIKPSQKISRDAFSWFTGLPNPFLNFIIMRESDEQLDAEVDHLISKVPDEAPLTFWLHEQNKTPQLEAALKKRGFQSVITCPIMSAAVKPCGELQHSIKAADLDTFNTILTKTFHLDKTTKEGYSKLLENSKLENYLIYKDGRAVGTGTIIPNGKTAGIFNISTLPEHQKNGYASTMTRFLMNRAAELEVEKLVLMSVPVANKLYADLGFSYCLEINVYAR